MKPVYSKLMGSKRKGVAVPTALLVVMLLFALGTVVHRQTTLSMRVGKHSEERLQARLMAQSAAALALERLNQDPAFEQQLLEGFQVLEESGRRRLEARLEASATPGVLLLSGRGSFQGRGRHTHEVFTTVRRQDADDHLFALDRDNRTLYHLPSGWSSSASPSWDTLPAPPTVSYAALDQLVNDGREGRTQALTADRRGHLYLGQKGRESALVLRYSTDGRDWTPLPALPDYSLDDRGQISFDGEPLRKIEQIATNGDGVLFVSSNRAVMFLADESATDWQSWKLLPPLPEFDEMEPDLDDLQKHFHDLVSDGQDHLYVRRHKRVYRLDSRRYLQDHPQGVNPSGTADPAQVAYWEALEMPLGSDGRPLDVRGLSATREGSLYLFEKLHHDSDVDRYYSYDPEQNSWSSREIPRIEYVDSQNGQPVSAPGYRNHHYRVDELAVSGSGSFYLRRKKSRTPLFEFRQGSYRTLPELTSGEQPEELVSGGTPAAQARFLPLESY